MEQYTQETTLEDLGRGGLRLLQPKKGFRYGTDSVLLADFASSRARRSAVELGAGCGVISFLMAARVPGMHIDAVELQPESADLLRRNIEMNNMGDRIRAVEGDLRAMPAVLGRERYELVVTNPPYFSAGPNAQRTDTNTARHESGCTCAELCAAAFSLLTNGGRLMMVYPAARLAELFACLRDARLAPKRLRCIQERPSKPCTVLLLEAVKNGGEGLTWLAPLYLHDEDGTETAEYRRIYYEQ